MHPSIMQLASKLIANQPLHLFRDPELAIDTGARLVKRYFYKKEAMRGASLQFLAARRQPGVQKGPEVRLARVLPWHRDDHEILLWAEGRRLGHEQQQRLVGPPMLGLLRSTCPYKKFFNAESSSIAQLYHVLCADIYGYVGKPSSCAQLCTVVTTHLQVSVS